MVGRTDASLHKQPFRAVEEPIFAIASQTEERRVIFSVVCGDFAICSIAAKKLKAEALKMKKDFEFLNNLITINDTSRRKKACWK
jgi:hypothetical protein